MHDLESELDFSLIDSMILESIFRAGRILAAENNDPYVVLHDFGKILVISQQIQCR